MDHYGKIHRKINPRVTASFFSFFTFTYTADLFRKAYKRDLDEDDIYEVLDECKSQDGADKLQATWQLSKQVALPVVLWKHFGRQFVVLGVVQIMWKFTKSILEPRAIAKLVGYFAPGTLLTFNEACQYGMLIIALKFGNGLFMQNYWMYLLKFALQVKSSLCSLVFRKSLRLHPHSMGVGNIITVMTKDLELFETSLSLVNDIWIEFLKTILVCYLIYAQMGVASFIGIAILVLMLPLQAYIGNSIKHLRLGLNKKTDERLQATQEMLSTIKIIKMYTWEQIFVRKIKDNRAAEMRLVLKLSYLKSINFIIGIFSSKIGLYVLLMSYIYWNDKVEAEVIFYVMKAFHDLKHSLGILIPIGMGKAAELIAGCDRINKILTCEEVNVTNKGNPEVTCQRVTVEVKGRAILKDITMQVKPGLTVVTGPLGGGKSTLLRVFLNNCPVTRGFLTSKGSFSYCSQDPWLFPSSIKQNVVFGQPYDPQRYHKVLKVCALDYDLALLQHRDETLVTDGGSNLSGGQQARINLARAVYKKSDFYLLDDPLHALDPHVQNFVYQHCIKNFLKHQQVVLVTHNPIHKLQADNLIVVKEGQVVFEGKPDEICEDFEVDESVEVMEAMPKRRMFGEVKKEGKVEAATMKKYFDYGGGLGAFAVVVLMMVMSEAKESVSSRLFTNWINAQQSLSDHQQLNATTTELQATADWNINLYSTLVLFSFAIDLLVQFLMVNFSRRASLGLHNAMIQQLSTASMTFYNHNFIGNILNRFSQDLSVVDESLPHNINFFIMCILAALGTIMLISSVSLVFIIPSLLLVLVLYFLRVIYMPAARSLKRLEAAAKSPLIGHLNACLQGLTTIKASQVEFILENEFDRYQDVYTSAHYTAASARKALAFFMDILSALYMSFVVLKLLFFSAGLSGDVGLAITKTSALTMCVQWFLLQWSDMENDMTHVERALEYTEAPQDNYKGQALLNWPLNGAVIFDDVSLTYKLERVLKHVSFAVRPRQKVGVVGRTGAGKSSLVAALFRLYKYEGRILVDDVDIKTLCLDFMRNSISIIPQDPVLFHGTIRDNLDPLRHYTDAELWKTLEKVHMTDHISSLKLIVDQNLSTGQRQLICLARAIIKKNKIVVLDEATANMDPETEHLIQKTIADNFSGCTVFIIAHRLSSVLGCDKILVMDKGVVVEYDDPAVLLGNSNSHFARLMESDHCDILSNK